MVIKNAALLMVDIQNDFIPNGSLAVPRGDEVVPLANQLQHYFDLIIATQDWHPKGHASFADTHPGKEVGDVVEVAGIAQVLWPIHCVQDSEGAHLHQALETTKIDKIIYKGEEQHIDSYSAFFDNHHAKATGLADYLHAKNIRTVYVMGLATEYCVKYTTLDAKKLGFNVHLIADACRGVELHEGDIGAAIEEMKIAGAQIINMVDIMSTE